MYLKLKRNFLKSIVLKAISKAGSERKLAKIISISTGSLYRYKFGLSNISENNLKKFLVFLGENLDYNNKITVKYNPNWGKVKGGINCVNKKKKEGRFFEDMKKLHKSSSVYMKKQHIFLRENFPGKYYKCQYKKFKKINGGYTHSLTNSLKVRNKLEQDVGNFLISAGFNFDYEPYIQMDKNVYFPDFIVGNVVIEVTEWRHPSLFKLQKLRNRIENLSKNGFFVILFISLNCRKFYKEFNSFIISDLSLLKGLLDASLAQSIKNTSNR